MQMNKNNQFIDYSVNSMEDGTPVFRLDSGKFRGAIFYFDEMDFSEEGEAPNITYTVIPYGWYNWKDNSIVLYDDLSWRKKKIFNNNKFLESTKTIFNNCMEIGAAAVEEEEAKQESSE